jgi:IS30 family transposase
LTDIGASNGLLRQYLPKGSDLRAYSAEQLAEVAAELNSRPRKTLGWHTPAQRLATYLMA